MAHESTAQRIGIGKAAFGRDLLRQPVAGFQKLASGVDACRFHPRRGRDADFLLEDAGKMAGAETRTLCQAGDGVIFRRIGGNPALYLLQGGAPARFRFAAAAELHLSAGPLEEHHQLRGDFQGDITAKILFDQGKRHIETGGDTSRRAQRTIAHMQCISVHMKRGVGCCERIRHGPVRCHPPAIEKPGSRKKESAAAHRTETPRLKAGGSQPLPLLRGQADVGCMRATGNQHRIADIGLNIRRDAVRQQTYPGRTADRSGFHADHLQLIFRASSLHIGLGEDVHRPGDVEKLDAGHGQQGNGSHVSLHGIGGRILAEYDVSSQLLP